MAKQSLKVVIAGRTYPLSVTEQEVNKVQAAADEINKAIKALQKNYAVKDMQDLLAMTTLQMAVKENGNAASNVDDSSKKELEETKQELIQLQDELDNL